MSVIGVLSCGIGNARSIYNLLYRLGYSVQYCLDEHDLRKSSHLIIPGVGSFDSAITTLHERQIVNPILNFIKEGKPVLGICIGMQIMFESSEEGRESGFGFFEERISKIPNNLALRVPNTAWLDVIVEKENNVFDKSDENRFYHNHSYAFQSASSDYVNMVLASHKDIVVGVSKENVYGIQFHPEKSHQSGHRILEKFCNL